MTKTILYIDPSDIVDQKEEIMQNEYLVAYIPTWELVNAEGMIIIPDNVTFKVTVTSEEWTEVFGEDEPIPYTDLPSPSYACLIELTGSPSISIIYIKVTIMNKRGVEVTYTTGPLIIT